MKPERHAVGGRLPCVGESCRLARGTDRQLPLTHEFSGKQTHVLVAMDQHGVSCLRGSRDQGVGQRESAWRAAAYGKCRLRDGSIQQHDLVEQQFVLGEDALHLAVGRSQFPESAAKLGQRQARNDQLRLVGLE